MQRAPSPLRLPRQPRSRATLERLLDAAQALLAEKGFGQASVSEISRRARSSVGSFYARFASKEALLEYLDRDLFDRGRAQWDAYLRRERWEGASTRQIVEEVVRLLVWKNRAFRPLLRALALYARAEPDAGFLERSRELNEHVVAKLRELILDRRHGIRHPDPVAAIGVGLLIAASAAREAILFEETSFVGTDFDDEDLARELTRAYLGYLGIAPSAKPSPKGQRLNKNGRRILSR